MAVGNGFHVANIESLVVCIGASGTAQGWPALLQPLLGQKVTCVNAGVNGDRTDQMLVRLATDVIALHPSWCTVDGGGNDCFQDRSAASIEANLAAIYAALVAAGITPKPQTIDPFGSSALYTPARETVRQTVNAWILTRGFDVANLDGPLGNAGNPLALNPAYDSGDGVHPNAAGRQVVANTFFTSCFAGRPL